MKKPPHKIAYLWQLGGFFFCSPDCPKQPRASFLFYKFFYPTISCRLSGYICILKKYFKQWCAFLEIFYFQIQNNCTSNDKKYLLLYVKIMYVNCNLVQQQFKWNIYFLFWTQNLCLYILVISFHFLLNKIT